MEDAKRKILEEHLPYELEMLTKAFAFLHDAEHTVARNDSFLKNSAIEVFWVHARDLILFFKRHRNSAASGEVSAKGFTDDSFFPDLSGGVDELCDKINEQICHLKYERKTSDGKLHGYDMLRVKDAIQREMKNFESHLLPECKSFWRPPADVPASIHVDATRSATSFSTMVSSTTGPGGPQR